VQAALEAATTQHGGSGRHTLSLEQLPLSTRHVHLVRNRYLHRSVSDKIGNDVNSICQGSTGCSAAWLGSPVYHFVSS
jgi:hypothetical protein